MNDLDQFNLDANGPVFGLGPKPSRLKTARDYADALEAAQEENARLQAAVDYAIDCAANEVVADVEKLTDMAEG